MTSETSSRPDNSLDKFLRVYNDIETYPTVTDVAREMGVTEKRITNRAAEVRHSIREGDLDVQIISRSGTQSATIVESSPVKVMTEPPSKGEDFNDLISRICDENDRYIEFDRATRIIDLEIDHEGPILVQGLPDPHLNNKGTDLRTALKDAIRIKNTDGAFAVGVGDWLDNFIIGRLERERRHDNMSHSNANRIQDFYIELLMDKFIAACGGNHNDWVENLGGIDMLGHMFEDAGKQLIYHPDQVRVRLNLPSGHSFIHLCRHIFPGQSQWNPLHGIMKWVYMQWQGEDVLWGGHIHQAMKTTMMKELLGEEKKVLAVQLPAYKIVDGYALKRGFTPNRPFTSIAVIHDPRDGSTTEFEDIDKAFQIFELMKQGVL